MQRSEQQLDRRPHVLVVDDNAIASLLVEDALLEAGLSVEGPFSRCTQVARWLETTTPSLAVIDVRLSDGSCETIARTLRERGVPFAVRTAWDCDDLSDAFKGVPRIPKPSSTSDLLSALKSLLAERIGADGLSSDGG